MSTHFSPDRTFFSLVGIKKGWDDFEIIGVFSLENDALSVKSELDATGLYDLVANPEQVHMDIIIDELIKNKLGKLKATLEEIVAESHGLKSLCNQMSNILNTGE